MFTRLCRKNSICWRIGDFILIANLSIGRCIDREICLVLSQAVIDERNKESFTMKFHRIIIEMDRKDRFVRRVCTVSKVGG